MVEGLFNALREMIERAAEQIRTDQVVDAYLAGGAATYLHLIRASASSASEARYSEDADIQFSRPLNLHDVVVGYTDREGEERVLALDRTYNIDIGMRHPDCFANAEHLFDSSNGRLRLYMLSPLDLATTKVGRFEDHDRMDIELLARARLLDADEFERRAREALEYLATDTRMVEINIREAVEMIRGYQV